MREPTVFIRKPQDVICMRFEINGDGRANYDDMKDFGAQVRRVTFENSDVEKWELWCGPHGANGWVELPLGHWVCRGGPDHFYPIANEYVEEHFVVKETPP